MSFPIIIGPKGVRHLPTKQPFVYKQETYLPIKVTYRKPLLTPQERRLKSLEEKIKKEMKNRI